MCLFVCSYLRFNLSFFCCALSCLYACLCRAIFSLFFFSWPDFLSIYICVCPLARSSHGLDINLFHRCVLLLQMDDILGVNLPPALRVSGSGSLAPRPISARWQAPDVLTRYLPAGREHSHALWSAVDRLGCALTEPTVSLWLYDLMRLLAVLDPVPLSRFVPLLPPSPLLTTRFVFVFDRGGGRSITTNSLKCSHAFCAPSA